MGTDPLTHTGPIWLPGAPQPKGSMTRVEGRRAGDKARWINDNPRYDPWEDVMVTAMRYGAANRMREPLDGPVELVADFYLPKPKTTQFRDAPIGTGIGDLDKLVRGVGDAAKKALLVTDDSRIARVVAEKLWARPGSPGATVELRPYTPPPATPLGDMPVRVQVGRINTLIGSLADVRGLPNLLRETADRIEKARHAA